MYMHTCIHTVHPVQTVHSIHPSIHPSSQPASQPAIHIKTYMHNSMLTYIHTYVPTYVHAQMYTCMCFHMNKQGYVCIYTHTCSHYMQCSIPLPVTSDGCDATRLASFEVQLLSWGLRCAITFHIWELRDPSRVP